MLPNLSGELRYLLPVAIASSSIEEIQVMSSFIMLCLLHDCSTGAAHLVDHSPCQSSNATYGEP